MSDKIGLAGIDPEHDDEGEPEAESMKETSSRRYKTKPIAVRRKTGTARMERADD